MCGHNCDLWPCELIVVKPHIVHPDQFKLSSCHVACWRDGFNSGDFMDRSDLSSVWRVCRGRHIESQTAETIWRSFHDSLKDSLLWRYSVYHVVTSLPLASQVTVSLSVCLSVCLSLCLSVCVWLCIVVCLCLNNLMDVEIYRVGQKSKPLLMC